MRIYTKDELESLIAARYPIGTLYSIDIAERHPSSHVHAVTIRGSAGEFMVEKELAIRQLFGGLRSGMFAIDERVDRTGIVQEYIFYGGGWGHGVGMCQVGAATMASKGYSYDDIIRFYYSQVDIVDWYRRGL